MFRSARYLRLCRCVSKPTHPDDARPRLRGSSPALIRDITQITLDHPSNPLDPQESLTCPQIAKTGDNDLVGIIFQLMAVGTPDGGLLIILRGGRKRQLEESYLPLV